MTVDIGTPEDRVLRSTWLSTVTASCEQVCNQLAVCDRADANPVLRDFIHALPLPASPAEWILLRGLLLGVAVRASALLHGRMHPTSPARCSLSSERMLDDLGNGPPDATLTTFAAWQAGFFGALDLVHPQTLGSSIGVLVRRDFKRRWSLTALAHHFKTTPAHIRRSFGRKFGGSVRDYQQLARVVAALEEVRSAKIDAIALNVGYQSKKNFYSAFRRLIGRTPTEYRRLPDTEALLLKERARQQLSRGASPQKNSRGK